MVPVTLQPAIYLCGREKPLEPAIGIGRQRVGMQYERARNVRLPSLDHHRAAPWRRYLDEIGFEPVEFAVQSGLVGEIPVIAIQRKSRGGERDNARIGANLLDRVPITRRQHGNIVSQLPADG